MMFHIVHYNRVNPAIKGYVMYQGQRHEMNTILGDESRGIFELNAGALPSACEAYYFHFELQDGSTVRLPEDPRYMFGTAGINGCTENHYYDTTGERAFAANAGPTVPGTTPCVGCLSAGNIDFENPSDAPLAA